LSTLILGGLNGFFNETISSIYDSFLKEIERFKDLIIPGPKFNQKISSKPKKIKTIKIESKASS
jgi:hypothetical protein